jgi:16S rRNA (cytosine1402-N4)-methyltransferase
VNNSGWVIIKTSPINPVNSVLQMSLESNSADFSHISVLVEELVTGIAPRPGGLYLDATVGGGGHTLRLFETVPDIQVWIIDRDREAIDATLTRLAAYRDRIQAWQGNFADFQPKAPFDGILADLGVSSPQFDQPERGFSFRHTAPLDMRMDQQQALTAADIINTWDEVELANLIYTYGEERLSRRIARRIVEQRPFETTTQLADAIAYCVPKSYRYGRIHPATRTFQALRIAVNQELESLETFLSKVPLWLKPQGRIGIISFHSLEDRIVKHRLKDSDDLKVLTKKPILPQAAELETNPRARSAKLRIAERYIENQN